MGLMSRRRLVLAKTEANYGVDPAPDAATNAILISSFSMTPIEAVEVSREIIRPFFGNAQKLIASINSSIEIGVEMAGSGTPGIAPGWAPLMKACAIAETVVADTSVTYKPTSDPAAFKAVTIYVNNDGKLYKFTGAFGSASWDMEIDKIPNFKFKFIGLYQPATDFPMPAVIDYDIWQAPSVVTNANTTGFALHGAANLSLSKLSFDLSNDVQFRSVVGAASSVKIGDRKPSGSVTIDDEKVAVKNWDDIIRTGALGALAIQHGQAGGNKVLISAPKVGLGKPSFGEYKTLVTRTMEMTINPDAGDDDLSIVLE